MCPQEWTVQTGPKDCCQQGELGQLLEMASKVCSSQNTLHSVLINEHVNHSLGPLEGIDRGEGIILDWSTLDKFPVPEEVTSHSEVDSPLTHGNRV